MTKMKLPPPKRDLTKRDEAVRQVLGDVMTVLYGDRGQSQMARALAEHTDQAVSQPQVSQWLSGSHPAPAWAVHALRRLVRASIEHRKADLDWLGELYENWVGRVQPTVVLNVRPGHPPIPYQARLRGGSRADREIAAQVAARLAEEFDAIRGAHEADDPERQMVERAAEAFFSRAYPPSFWRRLVDIADLRPIAAMFFNEDRPKEVQS